MYGAFRKITAFAFALLIALPLVFIGGMLVKQKIIRFQREERMERELLQTITVATEKIHWIKQGKEILLEGRMFDVKNFRQESGSYTLTGFFDDEEDTLHGQMKNITGEKKDAFITAVFNFLQIPVYHEPEVQPASVNQELLTKQYSTYAEKPVAVTAAEIIHPPAA